MSSSDWRNLFLDFLHPNLNGERDTGGYSSEEDSRYPPQMALTPIPSSPVPPEDGKHSNPTRPPILPRFSFEVWLNCLISQFLLMNFVLRQSITDVVKISVRGNWVSMKFEEIKKKDLWWYLNWWSQAIGLSRADFFWGYVDLSKYVLRSGIDENWFVSKTSIDILHRWADLFSLGLMQNFSAVTRGAGHILPHIWQGG